MWYYIVLMSNFVDEHQTIKNIYKLVMSDRQISLMNVIMSVELGDDYGIIDAFKTFYEVTTYQSINIFDENYYFTLTHRYSIMRVMRDINIHIFGGRGILYNMNIYNISVRNFACSIFGYNITNNLEICMDDSNNPNMIIL